MNVFCIYGLSSVIAIRPRQGIPRQHAITRPRHALPLPLPTPRHVAGPGRECSPGRSVAVVCDHPRALPRPRYAGGGLPGDTAAAVGSPSPLRRMAPCSRKRSARRETPARPISSRRRQPASPSPTATAKDEGRRGCRRGGGRATAAARRTGQVPQTVVHRHTNTPTPLPPHGERVAVAVPCRRPAGVPPRPRHRCTDHPHVGREKCLEGARPRQ